MREGTTPTHTFEVDINTNTIKEVKITYKQNGKLLFFKKKKDCTIENGVIKTKLTQEETLLFNPEYCVDMQVKILSNGGDVATSDKITRGVEECLDDEVLV